MMHNNWKGLVIDGSQGNIDFIKSSPYYWRYDLKAICSFITRENINQLFTENGFTGELGILSIDIDGNDYWVWEAIDSVAPDMVICEYNSLFGPDKKVTIPYKEDFVRQNAHHSYLYAGASIAALIELGKRKGYSCIGSNTAGNNAFFVRDELSGGFDVLTSREAYVEIQARESRDENGRLSFLSGEDRLRYIKDMPLLDIETGETAAISEIYGIS